MSRERWFCAGGAALADDAEHAAFDWSRAARACEVSLDVARGLYRRAMRTARDAQHAETLYLCWLRDAAAARPPEVTVPVPGRRTRTAALRAEADADADRTSRGERTELADRARRADPTERIGPVERAERAGGGDALPADLAARLSPFVGAGAARAARLHTDDAAHAIAGAHRARALTVGTDIFFARGELSPGTARGDELLVHELTHVAQAQRGELSRAAAKGIDSGGPLDAAEAEADLRARLALVQLHPADSAAPALATPAGQPTTAGDRTARLAAQQQRIALASQAFTPLVDPPAPAPVTAQAPVANPPPALPALPSAARSPGAYAETWQATPSKQALELWATAGTRATAEASAEQARFNASLPQMPVVLVGVEPPATTGGSTAPGAAGTPDAPAGAVPADATAPPVAQQTADQVARQTAATLAAIFAPKPTPTATPDAAVAQAQAQADGQRALDTLPTTAPAVATDPGAAPMTDLAGQADPVRTLGDHQQAIAAGAQALDDARTAIIAGPGAAQVQPSKLDDKLTVPAPQDPGAMPALPTIEGMTKLKGWNLPATAQAAFDGVARPKLDAHLTQASGQITQAETARDADRAKAVTDAEDKVKQAHADADLQQQTKVAETRARIANQQADALLKHEAEVKKLDVAAGAQKTATITKINDRITADQTKADTDFKDAQKRADDRKKQGEDEAARKKKDAQDRAASQSWWDQLVGAISDAIQSIASDIAQVLDGIATAIGQILDEVKTAACQLIDAARDFVCQALADFGDWLKSQVDALIGSVFPGLAAALDALIDQAIADATSAVHAIADDLKAGVTALCDGLKAAVDGVIAAFKAAVQAAVTLAQAALTGDWGTVARMVIDGVLAALGIDPAAFYALVGTAQDSLEKIVENPGAFVGHLVDAVKLGFRQFGDNFWPHLQSGLLEWLTGTFSGIGLRMPASFDVAGIFDLVCQVLGLTWPRLRTKVAGLIGEDNTERLEHVAGYLQTLVTGGFTALWAQVQQDLSNLWDMVVGGIRDWLVQNVVQQALIKLATMWNPIGAIFELIQTAWNAYQWLRQNAQRIFGLVETVVSSISNIVAGDISGAANLVEGSLARLVPIAISLFADLIGLGGIADQVRAIIEQVQTAVDQAIDALIERVLAMFKGDEPAADTEGDEDPGEDDEWWKATQTFTATSGTHTLLFVGEGDNAVLTICSYQRPLAEYVGRLRATADDPAEEAKLGPEAGTGGDLSNVSGIQQTIFELKTTTKPDGRVVNRYSSYTTARGAQINNLLLQMAEILRTLPDPDSPHDLPGVRPASVITYAAPHTTPQVGQMSSASQDGQGVDAKLTSVPGSEVGSMAAFTSPLLASLKNQRGIAIAPAHLLNHHLYGTGARAENLAPVPKGTNGDMANGVEDQLQKAVLDDNKAVHYSLTVQWPTNPNGRGGPNSLPEDKQLPVRLVATLTEYEFNAAAFLGATGDALTQAMSDWNNWKPGPTVAGSPFTYNVEVPDTAPGMSRLERMKQTMEKMQDDFVSGRVRWRKFVQDKHINRDFSAPEQAELRAYYNELSGGSTTDSSGDL